MKLENVVVFTSACAFQFVSLYLHILFLLLLFFVCLFWVVKPHISATTGSIYIVYTCAKIFVKVIFKKQQHATTKPSTYNL